MTTPGVFGVFYYRSANPRTLATLRQFLPVPVEPLAAEFAAGLTPVDPGWFAPGPTAARPAP